MLTPPSPKPSNLPELSEKGESEADLAPQSNSNKALPHKPWPLIFGLIILVVGGGGGYWWFTSQGSQNRQPPGALAGQPPAMAVKLTVLQLATLENTSEVVGNIEADRALVLKPETDGRVIDILVKEGSSVKKGQVILRLDSDDLQAELFQAKAKVENTKARLEQLQAGNRPEDIAEARASLREAQVRLTNAKKGARPEEIAQAQAQLDSAQAEADLAKERVKRYRSLQQEGAISIDQFEQFLKIEKSAEASVREAQRRLSGLSKGRQSDISELEATVEKLQQNLNRSENGPRREEIAQAKADVAQAVAQMKMVEIELGKNQIKAPIDGIIGDIPVKLGSYVEKGDTLTTITENNRLEVNLSIPIEKAAQLRLGLPVELLDPQGKTMATGQISFISPDVSSSSQLVLAKATLSQFDNQLLNRQFVQVKVIWDKRPGILVPSTAISRLGGQTFVFVAETETSKLDNKPKLVAKQRKVKLGNLQGNDYQVLEGLKPGEKIVTAGILNLMDGAAIQPVKSEQ